MFGNWLNGIDWKIKSLIRVGVSDLLWKIWNYCHDVVFNKARVPRFMQVVHKAFYWTHMWYTLLPVEQQGHMEFGYNRMIVVVQVIFSKGGWRHSDRLHNA